MAQRYRIIEAEILKAQFAGRGDAEGAIGIGVLSGLLIDLSITA